jgi:predicted amidophosphoribosyltransferase
LNKEGYRDSVKIFDTHILDTFNDGENNEPNILLTDNHIVIVDIATINEELKQLCERIITYDKKAQPLINYISLLKAYDRAEMEKLIQVEKEKKLKLLEAKQKEDKAKKNLVEAVSSWECLLGGLHYSYLFYYYPTTCEFEATEEEWSNRWIVWDFKNTPGKTSVSDHQEALDKAIPMLKNKLLTTFEEESLKHLTLVCIPASSQVKTQARYEEFSNRICSELGMINAYPHISVISEKEERRLGGTSIDTNKLSFDENFFKGKYVLLFDDIITRGDSMRTFKNKMEELGAIVVGGLSLGKTKHERPVQPFPHIEESPKIFPPSFNNDDLPF